MRVSEIGEFALIDRIKEIVAFASADLVQGIDDDAAVFQADSGLALLTTDALFEGVHFDFSYMNAYQVGWRALAANLSDIAAMAGTPAYAVTSIGFPPEAEIETVLDLYRGMKALAGRFHTGIIGGDTMCTPERWFVNVTVFGYCREKPLLRSGARPGDGIFVTGHPGLSAAGLKVLQSGDRSLLRKYKQSLAAHIAPLPRIEEAGFLLQNIPVHAMIDISDGVASEVRHISKNSGAGAVVDARLLPIHAEVAEISARFGATPVDYSLGGGEDFELLFTAPAEFGKDLPSSFLKKIPITRIGEIREAAEGLVLIDAEGHRSELPHSGYDHFRK